MTSPLFPHIGTCSWKYDSWRGIANSDPKEKNYLREYSQSEENKI